MGSAEDKLLVLFVLQHKMVTMDQNDASLPIDFKFPFQNKSILFKTNLINKMTNQQIH